MRSRIHPRRAGRAPLGSYVAGGHPVPAPVIDLGPAPALELVDVVEPAPAPVWTDAQRAALLEELAGRMRSDWPADATMLAPPRTLPAVPPPARRAPLAAAFDAVAATAGREEARIRAELAGGPTRSLDWESRHDPASKAYGVRARLRRGVPLQDRVWEVGPALDQGTEGACVGMAVVDAGNVLEVAACREANELADVDAQLLGLDDALALYRRAQVLDDVPGTAYTGTSVLAGMLAGRERGLWDEFLWCFGTKDLAQAVLQVGPVVIGVPWLSGMYSTGPAGVVRVEGDPVGGHALAVVGLRMTRNGSPGPYFVWQNSWGPTYGDGGLGYVHHKDLARLLAGTGEAALPVPATGLPR